MLFRTFTFIFLTLLIEKRGSRHLRLRGSDMSLDARIAASKASNGLLTAPDPNEDGDEEKWIYLSYDDEQLIENVHAVSEERPFRLIFITLLSSLERQTAAGQNFSLYELQGIYAAFKENDMKLPRDYFNIVYCTFARINNPVMVDSIFDLFDRDHNGFVDYQGESARDHVRACKVTRFVSPQSLLSSWRRWCGAMTTHAQCTFSTFMVREL